MVVKKPSTRYEVYRFVNKEAYRKWLAYKHIHLSARRRRKPYVVIIGRGRPRVVRRTRRRR